MTGDAVVLDVQIAQLPVRAVSAVVDVGVMVLLYAVGVTLWALTLTEFDDALAATTLIVFTVVAFVGYPVAFEVATRGRSLGKMAMRLRVVSDDGGPERFRQALFRALASLVEMWMFFGAPAVFCSLVSARGKRVGDVFAGTMVISERTPALAVPPAMPVGLAWWAASLQLSALRADSAERARQFLARASQLEPRLRDRMCQHVYSEVAAQVSPPPPPGTPPPVVLAAVLAERHRREVGRWSARASAPSPPAAAPPPDRGPDIPDGFVRPR